MGDPQIPAALASVIEGVVSLHDFRPQSMFHPRPAYTFQYGTYTVYTMVPGDLTTIYNLKPLHSQGLTGRGQTIVAMEDSDVYNPEDWYTFRSTFGLNNKFPHGSFQQIHPQPSNSPNNGGPCADPGVVAGEEQEPILDAEWGSVAAPDAAIVLASCADTATNIGQFIAMQNLLTAPGRPAGIYSISVGYDEPGVGAAYNAYINQLYQIAVLQGASIFVASGDWGAAISSGLAFGVTNGIAVNALASTPNDVAVGGTDFADTYLNENATYWSPTNGKYFSSALSYIPEIPWNESCGSQLIANYFGYATTYGANGFCNSAIAQNSYFLLNLAGSGGPSACAFGTPNQIDVVGGTCRGYPKPLYQKLVLGNPKDGVRDIPDVSLYAAVGLNPGVWLHTYIFCDSDVADGWGCTGEPMYWGTGGGTSFGAPIMAGVQAIINQATGSYQGNPNYVYYALAALEYDFGGAEACNSNLGNKINPRCVFHDITMGDIDVDCLPQTDGSGNIIATLNCYIPNGTFGVLSQSNTSYEPAYPATRGWDYATGLGSADMYNLVKSWPGANVH